MSRETGIRSLRFSSCNSYYGCWRNMHDIELSSNGQVRGRINYRLSSACVTDFTNYPEDHNDCCMALQAANEYENQLRFDVEKTNSNLSPGQTVTVGVMHDSHGKYTKLSKQHSEWKVEVKT